MSVSKYIPPELETKFLLRLPMKTLLKFRTVCKRWRSLISSAEFIKQHLSICSVGNSKKLVRFITDTTSHEENYRVFSDDTFNVENSIDIWYPFNKETSSFFRIVGYCNGVLCLSDVFGYSENIVLWNPSIKRAITLPTPTVSGPYSYDLGFGYDANNDDLKVVRLGYVHPVISGAQAIQSGVEVFSVSSGEWSRVQLESESCIKTSYDSAQVKSSVVYDGIVHWVGYKVVRTQDRYKYNSIMTFDLSSETFGELVLPSEIMPFSERDGIKAIVIRGLFSVLDFDDRIHNPTDYGNGGDPLSSCAIWVMQQYGNVESWVKLYRVALDGFLRQVIGMKRNGEIICGRGWEVAEMVTYNGDNMTTTSTGISGARDSFFVDDYVESLVLLGKGEEVSKKEDEEIEET